jgi:hypothetical protein
MTTPDENHHIGSRCRRCRIEQARVKMCPWRFSQLRVLDNSFECGDCPCLGKLSGMEVLWTSCGKYQERDHDADRLRSCFGVG